MPTRKGAAMTVSEQTIAQSIAEMKAKSAARRSGPPPAAFAAEVDRLVAAGVPADAAAIGTPMPDGEPVDPSGAATSLSAVRNGRPAVVVFYRGAWCPYCNLTLRAYEETLIGELTERGVELIAISPQLPDGSLSTKEKNALSYAVLSDSGNQIARQLGIVFTPGQGVLEAQQSLGLDLTAVNADGTAQLPLATTVLVDATGVIAWIDIHPDYSTRTEPADILAAVDRLAKS